MGCTHTSDWWKQVIPCVCCGAQYSDEEAERISNNLTHTFTSEQAERIERMKAESEESDGKI